MATTSECSIICATCLITREPWYAASAGVSTVTYRNGVITDGFAPGAPARVALVDLARACAALVELIDLAEGWREGDHA
jgi:hypothetical protein